MAVGPAPRARYGEAFLRAHHEARKRGDLNPRQSCETQGLPLKEFGNGRAKFKSEPAPPPRKLLYRRDGASHTPSHSPTHSLSHATYPSSVPLGGSPRGCDAGDPTSPRHRKGAEQQLPHEAAKPPIHRLPGREVLRQHAPGAVRARRVADRVQYPAKIGLPRASPSAAFYTTLRGAIFQQATARTALAPRQCRSTFFPGPAVAPHHQTVTRPSAARSSHATTAR